MLSVIIPTLDSERKLVNTLASLVPAVVEGVVKDVVISDGGSDDDTQAVAFEAGVHYISAKKGRGSQLHAGAEVCKGEWLLFLHDDTMLEYGWEREVAGFISDAHLSGDICKAACFKLALDDQTFGARMLEMIVRLRCYLLSLPYGDQGLLISKKFYKDLGGYGDMPLMEDVALIRRISRRQLTFLKSKATTSAVRYKKEGYIKRMFKNALCLSLYYVRVPTRLIVKIYES